MSALVGRCTYPFYLLRISFINVGQEYSSFRNANCTNSRKILSIAKYELLGTLSDSVIHANGRIPRCRTNWQTLTHGMYGSVKWCIASEVAFVDRRTCAWATRHFPQKPYYFHSICPLVRTPARIGSLRTRMRTFIAHEEKFLSANFIEDDRMITALREFLINRGNFFIVTANLSRTTVNFLY